jgi:DNA-binding NarL/FixJ family response regulator
MSGLCDVLAQQGYVNQCIASDSAADLGAGLNDAAILVVVLHVDLVDVISLPHLMRLRLQRPTVDWMLAWHGRAPQLAELVIRTRARGGIDLADLTHAAAAIDRVAAGQLWLPRWMLHDLYAALLDDRHVRAVDAAQSDDASDPALTRREAAALDLVRQGYTNRDIGVRLQISVSTVKKHLKNAFDKRGLNSRRQALG